jgi:hypothetical protein
LPKDLAGDRKNLKLFKSDILAPGENFLNLSKVKFNSMRLVVSAVENYCLRIFFQNCKNNFSKIDRQTFL